MEDASRLVRWLVRIRVSAFISFRQFLIACQLGFRGFGWILGHLSRCLVGMNTAFE